MILVAIVILLTLGTLWVISPREFFQILLSDKHDATAKLSYVRDFFASLGYGAPIAYFLFVMLEVVIAPLPGTMLYAPGGAVFGGFWGGFLSLAGNVAGAAVACQLMRTLGGSIPDRFLKKESLRAIQTRLSQHGIWIVLLLRVNPFTSSDLISYAAGLTPMPTWKLCLGTALGMAPLCWLQSYAADHLVTAFPHLLYPLAVLCGIYVLIVVYVSWRIMRSPAASG